MLPGAPSTPRAYFTVTACRPEAVDEALAS
jgi:hypothetical protein